MVSETGQSSWPYLRGGALTIPRPPAKVVTKTSVLNPCPQRSLFFISAPNSHMISLRGQRGGGGDDPGEANGHGQGPVEEGRPRDSGGQVRQQGSCVPGCEASGGLLAAHRLHRLLPLPTAPAAGAERLQGQVCTGK